VPAKFGKAIWNFTGKGNNVDMVFEHPGEATFPRFVHSFCKRGGMVVILRRHDRVTT
jgi:crotonyl-CoA carboxylase/reductase